MPFADFRSFHWLARCMLTRSMKNKSGSMPLSLGFIHSTGRSSRIFSCIRINPLLSEARPRAGRSRKISVLCSASCGSQGGTRHSWDLLGDELVQEQSSLLCPKRPSGFSNQQPTIRTKMRIKKERSYPENQQN